MRGHLLLLTAYAIIAVVCSTTLAPGSTNHVTSHVTQTDSAQTAHPTDSHTAIAKTHESHTTLPIGVNTTKAKAHESHTTLPIGVNTTKAKAHESHTTLPIGVNTTKAKAHESHTAPPAPPTHTIISTTHGTTSVHLPSPTLKKDHPTSHVSYTGSHTALQPGGHTTMSKTQGTHTALPPHDQTITSKTLDSLSEPIIQYSLVESKAVHITCFSKSGPLPIRYQLFINGHMQEEKSVHKPESANFTIPMRPGIQIDLNCKAISPSLRLEKSSKNVTLRGGDPEDFGVSSEETETEKKDKDTGPEHLIPLQYILTSVTPEVLARNILVLTICGPILLVVLLIFIFVSYFRSRKEHRMDNLGKP